MGVVTHWLARSGGFDALYAMYGGAMHDSTQVVVGIESYTADAEEAPPHDHRE